MGTSNPWSTRWSRLQETDLANKPATVQVQKIIKFFKDTMPASQALMRYVEWDKQGEEILRRAALTESELFVPLLMALWAERSDAGYKELKLAFPQSCSGEELKSYITVLGVRARLPGDITHPKCTALCDIIRGGPLAALNTPMLPIVNNAERAQQSTM